MNEVTMIENRHELSACLYECGKTGREKNILLLGKDSSEKGIELLHQLSKFALELGYNPIILRKQPEIRNASLHDKLIMYAIQSRFAVVLDHEISGHVYELAVLNNLRTPTVILRQPKKGSTYMVADIAFERDSATIIKYDPTHLKAALKESIKWADGYIQRKINYLNRIYPWRK